jgi:hypothetical protein
MDRRGLVGGEMTFLYLPAWMEILVNVIGYAGFVGLATWHKSSDEVTADPPLHSRGTTSLT